MGGLRIEQIPIDPRLFEVLQTDTADGDQLLANRSLGVHTPLCRGRDDDAFGEPASAGRGEERVDVRFGDPVVRVVELTLNGGLAAIASFSDKVDPGVGPPPLGPLVPHPHFLELLGPQRVRLQE